MKSKTKVRAQVETTTIALPKLALTPSVGRVKQKDVVSVKVEFEGLDEVSFAIEPRGAFSLDLNPMTRPGTLRLKGLAASFHAEPLILLAEEALEGAPSDPRVLRRIQVFLDEFSAA